MGVIKRIIGLFLGLISILILVLFGLTRLSTISNLGWTDFTLGIGSLIVAFIIGKVMYSYLRAGLS